MVEFFSFQSPWQSHPLGLHLLVSQVPNVTQLKNNMAPILDGEHKNSLEVDNYRWDLVAPRN